MLGTQTVKQRNADGFCFAVQDRRKKSGVVVLAVVFSISEREFLQSRRRMTDSSGMYFCRNSLSSSLKLSGTFLVLSCSFVADVDLREAHVSCQSVRKCSMQVSGGRRFILLHCSVMEAEFQFRCDHV